MNTVPTPHIGAKKEDIARSVYMPGDPLRAKYIAEKYLSDVKCVTQVRSMLGFTGTYKGREVTVMGSGMGMPSMGIYSYELYHFYEVEKIIRIGSAGALQDHVMLMDIIAALGTSTDSNYASQYELPGVYAPTASFELLQQAVEIGKIQNKPMHVGNVLSSDTFYNATESVNDRWRNMGILAVDMEAAALYLNAAYAGRKALCLLTVSDQLYRKEYLNSDERLRGFDNMIELALEIK